jgi:hypothetical protein
MHAIPTGSFVVPVGRSDVTRAAVRGRSPWRRAARALAAVGALAAVAACRDHAAPLAPELGLQPGEQPRMAASNPAGPFGYIQICKYSTGTPAVTGTFNFSIAGTGIAPNPTLETVAVGNCTNVIQANPSTLTITETVPAGVALDQVISSGPSAVTRSGNAAVVTLVASPQNQPTIIYFLNRVAQFPLQVCKVGGSGVPAATAFTFTTSATGNTVFTANSGTAAAPGCVQIGMFDAGTTVAITEAAQAGFQLSGVTVGGGATFSGAVTPNPNLGTRTATVVTGTSAGTVTFTNVAVGTLKVCKVGLGAALGQNFSFIVAGSTAAGGSANQTFNLTAGEPGTPPDLGGNCVLLGGLTPTLLTGVVTVTEAAPPTGIVLSGINISQDRGTISVAARTASVTIGTGETVVTFTNIPSPPPPPTYPVQVCKVAGAGIAIGTQFSFTVTGQANPVSVAAGAGGGNCVNVGSFTAGQQVTITEAAQAGTVLTGITGGAVDLPNRRTVITVSATASQNVATFTNAANTGTLELCKVAGNAGAIGQTFNFTTNVPGVPTTTRTATAAGNCQQVGGALAANFVASVTELALPGFIVAGNVYTRTATIVAGTTARITFTNFRALRLCTLTQGFYKTHGPNSPGNQEDAVTATLLFGRLTGSPFVTATGPLALIVRGQTYTAADIEDILGTPVKGDQNMAFLHQLIAAELNVIAIGVAATPDNVEAAIAAGSNITLLTQFNEGAVGPGHCRGNDD